MLIILFLKEEKLKSSYNDEILQVDKVIVCAGSWSRNLTKKIGEDYPLDTKRGLSCFV